MKKRILTCIIIVLIIFLTSCTNETDNGSNIKSHDAAINIQDLNVELDLSEGESATCCYSDESQMIFSIGKRNGKEIGPLTDTDRLVVYNIAEKNAKEFVIKDSAYVYNAVPYKEEIIYVTYNSQDSMDENLQWYIRSTDNKTIDAGICNGYNNTPCMTIVDGQPYYLYSDDNSESGIKKVTEGGTKTIFFEDTLDSPNPLLFSNGEKYCFILQNQEETVCYIGDEMGIKYKKKLDKGIISFGISDNFVLCSVIEDESNYKLVAINLTTGNEICTKADKEYYRITGSGDAFLAVDGTFKPFHIKVLDEKLEVEEIKYSPFNFDPIFFFSVGANEFFVEVGTGLDKKAKYYDLKIE